MVTLRCTQKLLRRGLPQSEGADEPPTTLLGDWYANVLVGKPDHLVLAIGERTLLPVVILARDPKRLPERLADAVSATLLALGVGEGEARHEHEQMRSCRIGRTASKRVLGALNEFMFQLKYQLHAHPHYSHLERSLDLAAMPCKPVGYNSPDRATRALFQSAIALGRVRLQSAI